jgi:hypothetical protein
MELYSTGIKSTGMNDLKMKGDPATEGRSTKASKEHRDREKSSDGAP